MNKINLKDICFIIPFYYDSPERFENLKCILRFLLNNFDTNISLVEVGEKSYYSELYNEFKQSFYHSFTYSADGVFHRTKAINTGIKHSGNSPYIAIYDTDVIFKPENIVKAVELLRNGATLTYPYSGDFVDVKRSYIQDGIIIERESFAKESVGGACFLNREDYWKCGLENENYIKHCPDDVDRFRRVKTLGYKIQRVEGKCWHISHPPSSNSGVNNYTEQNNKEWLKLKEMGRGDLMEYIKTWTWAKK